MPLASIRCRPIHGPDHSSSPGSETAHETLPACHRLGLAGSRGAARRGLRPPRVERLGEIDDLSSPPEHLPSQLGRGGSPRPCDHLAERQRFRQGRLHRRGPEDAEVDAGGAVSEILLGLLQRVGCGTLPAARREFRTLPEAADQVPLPGPVHEGLAGEHPSRPPQTPPPRRALQRAGCRDPSRPQRIAEVTRPRLRTRDRSHDPRCRGDRARRDQAGRSQFGKTGGERSARCLSPEASISASDRIRGRRSARRDRQPSQAGPNRRHHRRRLHRILRRGAGARAAVGPAAGCGGELRPHDPAPDHRRPLPAAR